MVHLLIDQGTLMHTSRANFISVCGLALTQLLLAEIRPPASINFKVKLMASLTHPIFSELANFVFWPQIDVHLFFPHVFIKSLKLTSVL